MTQTEYEQKRRELWYEYTAMLRRNCASRYVFDKIFYRAYALGREKETITQEEIEEAAEDYVSFEKGKVQFMFDGLDSTRVNDEYDRGYKAGKEFILHGLFGPKCLPDETKDETKEPKPAGPKFNLGDIVRFKYCCTPYRIDGFKMLDGAMLYHVGEVWAEESDLEPYTEPTEEASPNVNSSDIDIDELVAKGCVPDPAKQFDNILKDSFSKERRLTIAAQMMQGLICAPLVPGVDPNPPAEYLAQTAFRLADALLAEWRKD